MTKTSVTCPECNAEVEFNERYCPACTRDLGPPNVRECGTAEERDALRSRVEDARKLAAANGAAAEWQAFEMMLTDYSGVVVAIPALVARMLVTNLKAIYNNYENLVGATRRTATPENDRHRKAVSSILFGTYGENILYGNLAINDEALATYGDVAIRLRDETVNSRTTFLECNSFEFAQQHAIKPGDALPKGYRAVWENRHELALAKLGQDLRNGQVEADWRALLVKSDHTDRSKDDFVEAHIYGHFNADAVRTAREIPVNHKRDAATRLDIKLALDSFARRTQQR